MNAGARTGRKTQSVAKAAGAKAHEEAAAAMAGRGSSPAPGAVGKTRPSSRDGWRIPGSSHLLSARGVPSRRLAAWAVVARNANGSNWP